VDAFSDHAMCSRHLGIANCPLEGLRQVKDFRPGCLGTAGVRVPAVTVLELVGSSRE